MKVLHAVRAAIARHLHIDAMTIEPEHALEGDLGMDPLDIALVVMRIESLCDIEIPPERAERVKTVEDIEICVRDQVEAGASRHGSRRPFVVEPSVNVAHAGDAARVDRVRAPTRRAMRRARA